MPLDPTLAINDCRIPRDTSPELPELANAGLAKAGFGTRLLLRSLTEPGETIYWAKNPSFSFFNGAVQATAHLQAPTFAPPPYSRSDMINGTSVFLFFRHLSLRRAMVQIMTSRFWANTFIDNFREVATATLGVPQCIGLSDIPLLPGRRLKRSLYSICTWESEGSILMSRIAPSGSAAFVRWDL